MKFKTQNGIYVTGWGLTVSHPYLRDMTSTGDAFNTSHKGVKDNDEDESCSQNGRKCIRKKPLVNQTKSLKDTCCAWNYVYDNYYIYVEIILYRNVLSYDCLRSLLH